VSLGPAVLLVVLGLVVVLLTTARWAGRRKP